MARVESAECVDEVLEAERVALCGERYARQVDRERCLRDAPFTRLRKTAAVLESTE